METSQDKMMKYLIGLGKKLPRGSMIEVGFYHDEWCPCSDGTRNMLECICDPDIATLPKPNRQQRRRPGK